MAGTDSTALIEALQQPAAYSHPVATIEMLQTHISWVLLTGEFAYKLKKPVDLGFADFSTLERRRHFCLEELRINRRLAPEMYLDVLPITGTATRPRVGGEVSPLEYCVRMRQFNQDALLSHLVATGGLEPRQLDDLARQVAEFHRRIPVAAPSSRFGTPESVADAVRATFDHFNRIDEPSVRQRLQQARDWCEAELARRREALAARKRDGFVRECHGDLHLGNMFLADDAITIFDAIEFNEDLRWIDVISDAAFCVMDLHHRRRSDLARRFLNAYLEGSGDYAGLVVLRLYLAYRALVRAKVIALRLDQTASAGAGDPRPLDELAAYIDLAQRLSQPGRPFLAITHGVSGSGKTWGSQAVIERTNAIRVRSDVERKRLAGVDPLAKTGSGLQDGIYSPEFSVRTYERLATLAASVLAAGFPALVDATFLKRFERERFRALAERLQVPLVILQLTADEATCRQRVRSRAASGADPSEATEEILTRQLADDEPLSEAERSYALPIDTTSRDSVDAAIEACERLR
jgi:aminoglycoside phosphotransferase family enzyme/predicted kinase